MHFRPFSVKKIRFFSDFADFWNFYLILFSLRGNCDNILCYLFVHIIFASAFTSLGYSFWIINPLVPSAHKSVRIDKISILKLEGIIKKISYERRDYESVDEKSLS